MNKITDVIRRLEWVDGGINSVILASKQETVKEMLSQWQIEIEKSLEELEDIANGARDTKLI